MNEKLKEIQELREGYERGIRARLDSGKMVAQTYWEVEFSKAISYLLSLLPPDGDAQEQAEKMVEAEFGTPETSPIYQTAGKIIERLKQRIAAAISAARPDIEAVAQRAAEKISAYLVNRDITTLKIANIIIAAFNDAGKGESGT